MRLMTMALACHTGLHAGGLASLVEARAQQLADSQARIFLFSYGSGCASTAMLLQARPCTGSFSLQRMAQQVCCPPYCVCGQVRQLYGHC